MTDYFTRQTGADLPPATFDYGAAPPVLVLGSSAAAIDRARRTIDDAGRRVASAPIDADVLDRLAMQGAASALWIELDRDLGAPLDALLDQVNVEASAGRYAVVVAAPAALVDPLAARLDDAGIELLIDAGPGERVAALALALAGASRPDTLHDVTAEPSSVRLRQLSDEVSRIAATLARLSSGPAALPERAERALPSHDPVDAPPLSIDLVRTVIRARRLRDRFFEGGLFADPAWDMLLDLLQAEIAQHRVPVSSLCIAAAVPATTALRWIKTMSDSGLFVRRADPHDGRRVFVELAPHASAALRRYFADVGKPAVV